MGRKKAHKIWRKEWRRALNTFQRNLIPVLRHFAGAFWLETPAEQAITVEVMLFALADEFAEWPATWEHTCYWDQTRVVPLCTCGLCVHGKRHHRTTNAQALHIAFDRAHREWNFCSECAERVRLHQRAQEVERMRRDGHQMLADMGMPDAHRHLHEMFDRLIDREAGLDNQGIFQLQMGPPQPDEP